MVDGDELIVAELVAIGWFAVIDAEWWVMLGERPKSSPFQGGRYSPIVGAMGA